MTFHLSDALIQLLRQSNHFDLTLYLQPATCNHSQPPVDKFQSRIGGPQPTQMVN